MSKDTKELSIPAPNTTRITVRIRGKTPLLQNAWTKRTLATMPGGPDKGKSGKKEKLSPDQEVAEILEAISLNGHGGTKLEAYDGTKYDAKYGVSKEAFPHGMASAGYRLGDWKMTEIRAAVSVPVADDRIPVIAPEPEQDSRAGSLAGRGATKVINRPRFWPWEMDVPLEFDRGVMNEEAVLRLLSDMGRGIGLGAFRPENSGTFGTFEVVSAEIM